MTKFYKILVYTIACMPIAQAAHARTLELQMALGANFGNPPGLSALPAGVTETQPASPSAPTTKASASTDFRVLLYPFSNSVFAVGMDFAGAVQGTPKITNTNANMSGYTEYTLLCTSSDVVVNFNLGEHPISAGGWVKGRYSLLAMGSLKANCSLVYSGIGKLDSQSTADAQSFGAGFASSWTLFNFFQFGYEVGYRSFKSSSLTDPNSQPVIDATGKPVSIDLSAPYLRLVVGLEF